MPRFFFDTHNGEFIRDDVGTDLPDLEAARIEAVRALPEIAQFSVASADDRRACAVLVRNEGGAIVYTATMTLVGLRLDEPGAG